MFLILCAYGLCASTFTVSKAVLSYAQPIFFVGFRMLLAGILLLGYEYIWNKRLLSSLDRKDIGLFIRIVLFHIYGASVLEMWAQQYLASFQASCFFNLSPFITALFSYVLFAECMTLQKIIGLILGFCGIVLPYALSGKASGFFSGSLAELAMLGAVVSSVYGWITMKTLLQKGYSPIFINGVGMLGGGLLALVTSLFAEQWVVLPVVSDWNNFLFLTILLILIANIVFYNMYGYLLQRYTATFLSFAGFVTPFFAALFGIVFLSESVDSYFFLSMFLVGVGLYLFYQEEIRHGYTIAGNQIIKENI